ncbi:hypothetical protein M0R45_025736 [Rubus argutus]|uniref:MULE transposase domain-containing protein n=1 Tax=Rubus argutus TaxID=59490 RepID=A0AAW1WUW2_RUBAR
MEFRGKPFKDLMFDDLRDVKFGTIAEVDEFYSYYSLANEFSMRKRRCDKNRAGTLVLCRKLVCSKEGQRGGASPNEDDNDQQLPKERNVKRTESILKQNEIRNETSLRMKRVIGNNTNPTARKQIRRLTRENCPSSMTVKLCKDRGVYYVSEFTIFHNHELARPEHRYFMRSHHKVKDSDIAVVSAMRKVSVKTSCAYEYLVHAAGGHEFVGFTIKDLYNKLNKAHEEVLLDGDAQACVTWMNMKAMRDPQFYCFFSVDEFRRLANMFWRDGKAFVNYNAFGEILIFDSTYKSNIYGKPLAVLVGCNNHRATILFGWALLVDETEETYMWLLTSFLTSMYEKKPSSVVTYGDEAMRNAIYRVLPLSRHSNCAWHIGKNVVSNLKRAETQREFCHLIFAGLTIEEWEGRWMYFVPMNELENNEWVSRMYNKRDRWAEAFFREFFLEAYATHNAVRG